ncbi:hypothetical protein [Ornithinimicrobium avium]|uniref:Uncharacterized protein n=1 Tax=Ornithinimicrobium avium TaxID=2283195 RepID=A0A345NIP7_9MICO|nr:hypothetical protein [Ornithinimicrobium avium]AXH94905.1 hypothetical protein DV701_00750 [Ornithinimicrobium avium]
MGRAVQVDPVLLGAGARRLARAASTLDTLSCRLAVLGGCAGQAAGAPAVAGALEGTGRDLARGLAAGAEAVARLAASTGAAGQGYSATEEALTGCWGAPEGEGRVLR